jgi:predicted AAA+ superfamily ATPase
MIKRTIHFLKIEKLLKTNPIVAILGPRQCGKTTISLEFKETMRFDLENPEDLLALENPVQLFKNVSGLIVIDEIQRRPELFSVLRYLVDHHKKLKFLILGSASPELIKQSSESLAGRIAYYSMRGFSVDEVKKNEIDKLWLRGGFPRSFIAKSSDQSVQWRSDYIKTYLEKDIPQLGIKLPSQTLYRFWNILTHYNGQILNYSEIGSHFGMSDKTIKHYIDILHGTFMVDVLQPWYTNIGKRQIKSPKIYFQDTGIFHQFLKVKSKKDLYSHVKLGVSWEAFVLSELRKSFKDQIYFWNVQGNLELDFYIETSKGPIGIEAKFNDAPKISSSMRTIQKDLKLKHLYIVYPGEKIIPIEKTITILPIAELNFILM